jgi:hypothetical protein
MLSKLCIDLAKLDDDIEVAAPILAGSEHLSGQYSRLKKETAAKVLQYYRLCERAAKGVRADQQANARRAF